MENQLRTQKKNYKNKIIDNSDIHKIWKTTNPEFIIYFLFADIVCSDAFPETSPGKADSQGVLQNGSFPMRHDCFLLCRNDGFRHFEKCFGFDYNNYDKSCHFSTNSNYSLTSRANTTHYRRARRCFNGSKSFLSNYSVA